MNEDLKLRELMRLSFEQNEKKPIGETWDNLNKRLTYQNFFKFGYRHVNIYNTSSFVFIILFCFFWIFSQSSQNIKLIAKSDVSVTEKRKINPKITPEAINNKESNFKYFESENSSKTYKDADAIKEILKSGTGVQSIIKSNLSFSQIKTHDYLLDNKLDGNIKKTEQPTIKADKINYPVKFAVNLYTIPAFTDVFFINNSNNQPEKLRQKFAAGASIKATYKNCILEWGIICKYLSKDFDFNKTENVLTFKESYKKSTRIIYNIETGEVGEIITDSILVSRTGYDTKITKYENINQYTSIEIPFSLGYNVHYRRFCSISKSGLIMCISKTAYGKAVEHSGNDVISLNKLPFYSADLALIFSNAFMYKFRKPYSFFMEPYFRYNFNNTGNSISYIANRKYTYGIKLGVEIEF